ncbi:MAG: putative DNA binding domain-containing protein, partial [Acidimicrobiales bacterium]
MSESQPPLRRDLPTEEVLLALRDHRYDDIRGVPENQSLDFKKGWYRLDEPKEKWELAKDVGAMANSGGGVIIRGVATVAIASIDVELATEVKPLPASKVDIKQHHDVLKTWLYPQVRGVTFEWLAAPPGDEAGENTGVLVITVPPQEEDQQPFIQSRTFDRDDKEVQAFNVAVRDGAHTDWLPPGVVQRDLADGRRARRQGTSLPPSTADSDRGSSTEALVSSEALVGKVEQFMGWGLADGTTLAYVAVPDAAPAVPPEAFYRSDGLRSALARPPMNRAGGFGLSYHEPPQQVGEDLVVVSAYDRCLWLEPSGVFAMAANARNDFLTWGTRREGGEPRPAAINLVVLTEWTYLYAKFVRDRLAAAYGNYHYLVRIVGAETRPWTLRLRPGSSELAAFGVGNQPRS